MACAEFHKPFPDQELEIWEEIAGVYLAVSAEFQLDQAQRKQLFELLLDATARQWDLADNEAYAKPSCRGLSGSCLK